MIAASRITWVERHVVVASQHCNFFPNLVNFPPFISIPFLPSFSSFLPALETPPPISCMSARRCLNSAEVCLKPPHLILGLISTLSCLYVLLDANASQGPNLSLRHSVSQSLSDKDGHHVCLYVFISMSLSLFFALSLH